MPTPTIASLLGEALAQHGFDGICDPSEECACKIGDLCLCGNFPDPKCVPGYKWTPDDTCPEDCSGEACQFDGWCIRSEPQPKKEE